MCSLSANLGDTRSIVTIQPQLRIVNCLRRTAVKHNQWIGTDIKVGLEHVEDIINDLKQTLERV